jgi:hypothetical protein
VSPLFLIWLAGPQELALYVPLGAWQVPTVVAQATDPVAAMAHMDLWADFYQRVVSSEFPRNQADMPKQASPALIALEKESAELPRWPGQDPLADAVLGYLSDLHRFQAELQPAFSEILYREQPRDADQARAEALWIEMEGIRYGGPNAVNQAMVAFGQANGVRVQPAEPFVPPAATGDALPGGAMQMSENHRRSLAASHLSEVRGICNQGVVLMNQAVGFSTTPDEDLRPLAESLVQTRAEMDAVPAWIGDAEFRDACSAVLQTQAGILEKEIPAMQEALRKGDTETFNSSARDRSAELRALQLDLYDAEANFRLRWGLQAREAPPQRADTPEGAQALGRMRHWSGLVSEAGQLSTQLSINLLLDGAEFQAQSKLATIRLAELQLQAENPPPFEGEDPLRRPAIAVLDVLEQSFGDWGSQAIVLLRNPKPREADQQRYQAIVEEEILATEKAVAAYKKAHNAFAEAHGITMISTQTLDSLHPPSFLVALPGPQVELSAQVRIAFAAAHLMEVNQAFSAGLESWNTFVGTPADAWPELLPQTRAVVAAAVNEVLSIPPWMGQETMVQAAEEALSTWLDTLDKHVPRMIELRSGDRSQRDVAQYNRLLDELNLTGNAGVTAWNVANTEWAEDWKFTSSQAHQEAMVEWARDSRALLKSR